MRNSSILRQFFADHNSYNFNILAVYIKFCHLFTKRYLGFVKRFPILLRIVKCPPFTDNRDFDYYELMPNIFLSKSMLYILYPCMEKTFGSLF